MTTVRLTALFEEHLRPLGLDLLLCCALGAVLRLGFGLPPHGWVLAALLAAGAAAHVVQTVFLLALRFDDQALTVIRPWRRTRVEWTGIGGLIHSDRRGPGGMYRLRLVLKGEEPPLGRYLTDRRMREYARGPVLMALGALEPVPGRRAGRPGPAARCRRRVHAELARHGLPRPEPRPLLFRSPLFSAEATLFAIAMDQRGGHAVAVYHGEAVGPGDSLFLDRVLPRLARDHAAAATTLDEPFFTSYFFEGPNAEQRAAAFLAAVRAAVPERWRVTPGTLPLPLPYRRAA